MVGVIVADETLRRLLQEQFPECFTRCQKRRAFMIEVLGMEVPDEVPPLSNRPAIVPPFFLDPNMILALEQQRGLMVDTVGGDAGRVHPA